MSKIEEDPVRVMEEKGERLAKWKIVRARKGTVFLLLFDYFLFYLSPLFLLTSIGRIL